MAVGLSELLAVGVEGPEIDGMFGAGVASVSSAGPSMLIIWIEGSFVSTTLGLESVLGLQVLTIGVQGARSSCCFMGDVVTTVRATSEPGEGRGFGEAILLTTATETICLKTDESATTGSCSPVASSSLMSTATEATFLSETNRVSFASKQVAAAAMVSIVTSRVRGAASLGVVAWLVSVSYVTGAEREELHGEEGQQESQEQLELLSELREDGPSLSGRCSSGPCCVSRWGSVVRGGCG